jgi:Formyl transferase
MTRIAVIASAENSYNRRIVRRLCESGVAPAIVLLGSRSERILFKLASFRRIRTQLGYVETVRRLLNRQATEPSTVEPTLSQLSQEYGFRIEMYDRVNGPQVFLNLFVIPNCVTLLAGCGLVDETVLAASRGGCINSHPALLPGLRGVDVLIWALYADQQLGVTAHFVAREVDAGDIILRREVQPGCGEAFYDFVERILSIQADTLVEAAVAVIEGRAVRIPNPMDKSKMCFAAPARVFREALLRYSERYLGAAP